MRRISFLLIFVFVLIGAGAGTGCKSKLSKTPSADIEENFRARWVAKRMGELQAGGVADAREARRMALEEFNKKYDYTTVAHKVDPVNGTTQ